MRRGHMDPGAGGHVEPAGPLRRSASRPAARGAGELEEGQRPDDPVQEQQNPDQAERLLQQMRRCVLVHHQLSCLLIHSAALQAGLYGTESQANSPGGDGPAGEGSTEIQRSIQSMGGSTARLFSMALRDQHDLEAMGQTLQGRVDEMIAGVKGEFELAGCNAEDLGRIPGFQDPRSVAAVAEEDHAAIPGVDGDQLQRLQDSLRAATSGLTVPTGCAGPEAEVRNLDDRLEVEVVAQECERLETELALQQADVARLRAELEETQQQSAELQHSVTVTCFGKVQLAEERNSALENILEELLLARGPVEETRLAAAMAQAGSSWSPASRAPAAVATSARGCASPHRRDPSPEPEAVAPRAGGPSPDRPDSRSASPSPAAHERRPASAGRSGRSAGRAPVASGPCPLSSPETLAQLDAQLRLSQSEFWGL